MIEIKTYSGPNAADELVADLQKTTKEGVGC